MKLIQNYKQRKVTIDDIRTIHNAIIWILVLIAITSIVWSISLHIISGDFNNGIIGAKLEFRARDFQRMDKRSKEVFYQDLGNLINRTYANAAALDENIIETTDEDISNNNQSNHKNGIGALNRTEDIATLSETTTIKPKKRKILHLFRTSTSTDDDSNDDDDDERDDRNASVMAKRRLDIAADREFLSNMVVDVDQSFWRQTMAVQFVYSFPFLTEIIAIIWTAMCLVFQSGVKKYWGLPKPWRIVVPSIFVFTFMTLGTMIYTIITNRFLKIFCTNLKAPLSDPDLISCGEAMSIFRPIVKRHQFRHDVYLNLFRASFILSLLLWTTALVIIVMRYVFAIDFQLVDVRLGYHNTPKRRRSSEMTPVRHRAQVQQSAAPARVQRVDERGRHKSEDDFQSAKSNISEVATPLLDSKPTTVVQVQVKKT